MGYVGEMRYGRRENREQLFKMEKFLTAQQIQGYFSRAAAKLKHATLNQSAPETLADASNDIQAVEEEEAYSSAHTSVLNQCQLTHPIVCNTLNVCSLYHANKLSKLTVAQLWAIWQLLQHGGKVYFRPCRLLLLIESVKKCCQFKNLLKWF